MGTISFVFPAVFVVMCIVAIPVISWILRRLHENMRAIAGELGLSYRGPLEAAPDSSAATGVRRFLGLLAPWRMVGNLSGVFVTISPETKGKTSYSAVAAHFPRPLAFTMRIGRETALARLGKAVLGLEDIEVGSGQFDEEVRIRGIDRAGIVSLLAHADVQERILAALRASRSITVTEKAAHWEKQGTVEETETYRRALDLVVPIVRALIDAGAFPDQDR